MIESLENPEEDELLIHFICPLTLEILREPVNTIYGHKFERKAILGWLQDHSTCPLTQQPLKADQISNVDFSTKAVIKIQVKNLIEKR